MNVQCREWVILQSNRIKFKKIRTRYKNYLFFFQEFFKNRKCAITTVSSLSDDKDLVIGLHHERVR